MQLPDRAALESAAEIVYQAQTPTPQYAWPQLAAALGTETWVKHENHTRIGAFKVRGGLVYLDELKRRDPGCAGVISATRGNHGQSIGLAARIANLPATIVVPHGNSREKNAAMRALGVELLEHGDDYQAAREEAERLANARRLHVVPPFHHDLVRGVATYWIEFFSAVKLDAVFVPIGMGSGISACFAARAAYGATTRVVGVVSAHAPCYALSFRARRAIAAPAVTQLADGLACRVPDDDALDLILRYADDIVEVTDDEIAAAMRLLFSATHNVAEGAGAAPLAAALKQRTRLAGKTVGLALSGGNVDADVFARVLTGADSRPIGP